KFHRAGILSDGSETPELSLNPLFEEYHAQGGGDHDDDRACSGWPRPAPLAQSRRRSATARSILSADHRRMVGGWLPYECLAMGAQPNGWRAVGGRRAVHRTLRRNGCVAAWRALAAKCQRRTHARAEFGIVADIASTQ